MLCTSRLDIWPEVNVNGRSVSFREIVDEFAVYEGDMLGRDILPLWRELFRLQDGSQWPSFLPRQDGQVVELAPGVSDGLVVALNGDFIEVCLLLVASNYDPCCCCC
jgi:hypothetical protein